MTQRTGTGGRSGSEGHTCTYMTDACGYGIKQQHLKQLSSNQKEIKERKISERDFYEVYEVKKLKGGKGEVKGFTKDIKVNNTNTLKMKMIANIKPNLGYILKMEHLETFYKKSKTLNAKRQRNRGNQKEQSELSLHSLT